MPPIDEQFEILPPSDIKIIEDGLREIIQRMHRELEGELVFIQFFDKKERAGDSFWTPSALRIGNENLKIEVLPPDYKGLTGYSAEMDKVVVWDSDPESKDYYYAANPGVRSEIVGPIHYRGKVTGVVVTDSLKVSDYNLHKERFLLFLNEIDRKIKIIEQTNDEDINRAKLQAIVNFCYENTASTRGYIAIKRWDGLLEYIKSPHQADVFLELAPHEGLCGRVFRTGKPVNPDDLMNESDYVPSDNNIKAEIIYPIIERGETIGVINMESTTKKWYDEKAENLMREQAEKAVPFASYYRKPINAEFGFAMADLFQSTFWMRPPKSQQDFIDDICERLNRWVARMFEKKRCHYWFQNDGAAPENLRTVSWDEAVKSGERILSNGRRIVFTPFLIKGDPLFIVGMTLENSKIQHPLKTLKALCQLASEGFQRAHFEYRMRKFVQLIDFLITHSSEEIAMTHAVEEIPFILQSRHCSLFYRLQIRDSVFFVPGPTTSMKLHGSDAPPGYPVDKKGGLTSYVAATGKELSIRSVHDQKELAEIDPELNWRSRISEEESPDCRSFLGFPIRNESGTVIGVLRTHRDSNSRRSGFTEVNQNMFRAITNLLGSSLEKFLERKTQ